MKELLCVILVVCVAIGLFGCGKVEEKAPENAVAKIVTNGKTQYAMTMEEMVKAIDASGNTMITLLKDIDTNTTIKLPFSCTIDLAGHTVTTDPEKGIGLVVEAAGSENGTTTVKNGILNTYSECIRVKKGAIVIEGMELQAEQGACVTIADNTALVNRIDNSKLISRKTYCVSWATADMDYSGCVLTITGSDLIACNPEGSVVFHKNSNAVTGLMELGEGTSAYSFSNQVASKNMLFNGSGMAKKIKDITVGDETISGITQWSDDAENQVIDVLMIGNSGCYYFTDELYAVADAAGVQLNIHNIYAAGCTVEKHWTWLQEDKAGYEQFWISNGFGRFKHPDKLKLSAVLPYCDWDVITLQQSGNPKWVDDFTKLEQSCDPYVKNIYDHLKTNHPDAKLYWHETWSWAVGYPADKDVKKVANVAQQTKQYNNMHTMGQKVCQENGVDVVPVGSAWQIARRNPQVGDTLTKTDLAHDGDIQGGQYLNACVWFETLTGRSCIGNTWRPETYELSEERIQQLQQIAHQAVAEVYGENYAK